MSLSSGTRLGPYEILAPLGAGGMGEVYKAWDPRLDRTVAIKVANEKFNERFAREARAVAAFNHLHICQIYDVGPNYLVMEYIEGQTLKGPLPIARVLNYAVQICDALDVAHKKGITHRDLKPTNILVGNSGIKLLDFGLAKMARDPRGVEDARTETVDLTTEHTILGTLLYMAPEQLEGRPADSRSDIFSLGAVLYEMITGRRAFQGASRASVIAAILERDPPSLTGLAPAALDHLVQRCLAKDPDERWQSARDLKYELEQIAVSGSATIQPDSLDRRSWRAPFPWLGAIAVALVVVLASWFWLRRPPKQEQASIAVLPFTNISPAKGQEYFSEGLADELLSAMGKIPELRVAGKTSSFLFGGNNEDSRVVGQKLNVATILEGSVRQQGNRVRVTARLIKAADRVQLWSDTFDGEMNDIFSVQSEIARAVAGALKIKLIPGRIITQSTKTPGVGAYNAYLQGRHFLDRANRENLEKAVDSFEQACKLDPGYAPAWTGLGVSRIQQALWAYVPSEEGYHKAREAVDRALALDPNLAGAHSASGSIKMWHDWNWTGADAAFNRARELDAGNDDAITGAGEMARILGHLDESIALYRKAIERDPLNPMRYHELGLVLHSAGRQEEAAAALRKSLDLGPETENSHALMSRVYLAQSHQKEALAEVEKEKHPIFRLCGLALAYHALGRKKESDAKLAELIAKYEKDSLYQIADVYAFRGEIGRAFEWLERDYAERDAGLTEMKTDPLLKSLRQDPRYTGLLRKLHLPL